MELWSPEHIATLIPCTMGMLAIAIAVGFALRNQPENIRRIPIQIVAVVFLLLEVGKQVLSLAGGYDLYHLPFHFCSLILYTMPFMAFYNGKHRQIVTVITGSVCVAITLLTLVYPCLIYSSGDIRQFTSNFFCFHTVSFHNLAIFATFLIFTLDLCHPKESGNTKAVSLFTLGFCVVSASFAQILQTNYNNFYSCNVPPLEDLRLTVQGILGYGATQALYVLVVTVVDILFVLMSMGLLLQAKRLLRRRSTV